MAKRGREPFRTSHFSLSNPQDKPGKDLPRLLRRMARQLEREGSPEVSDLVLHEDDSGYYLTVYYDGR
jgi:hypothetical protein